MSEEKRRKVLLFGGGRVAHDFRAICPLLEEYLNENSSFAVDYVAEDHDAFLAERLAPYDLIVLYHTVGELSVEQKRGLVEWVASGKGFVGVHAATTSFRDSPEYLAMLGGLFKRHPVMREYIVSLADTSHPVTAGIEGHTMPEDYEKKYPVYEYKVCDEQYLLDYDPRVHVLAATIYEGKACPVAWVKDWAQGRVFYLALGHDIEACRNEFFRKIFVNGTIWAAG